MMEAADIRAVLRELDPEDDDHWTQDGLPRLDLAGLRGLRRRDVTNAAPLFTRTAPGGAAEPVDEAPPDPGEDEPSRGLKEELEELEALLAEYDKSIEVLRVKREEAQKRRDELWEQTGAGANIPFHEAIKHHLNRQAQIRADKAAGARALQKLAAQAGVGGAVPAATKAPVDRAFESKRSFGGRRPPNRLAQG